MADLAVGVGLQLLLQPSKSSGLARAACVIVGTAYPIYASFKALSAYNPGGSPAAAAARERWLRYWSVLGALGVAEAVLRRTLQTRDLGSLLGAYPHLKLAALVWLQLRGGAGAAALYERALLPLLRRYEGKVDVALDRGGAALSAIYAQHQVPVDAATAAVSRAWTQASAALYWFFFEDERAGTAGGGSGTTRRRSSDGEQGTNASGVAAAARAAAQSLHDTSSQWAAALVGGLRGGDAGGGAAA